MDDPTVSTTMSVMYRPRHHHGPGHTLLGLQVLWYLVIGCTTSLWYLRQTQRSSANDHWHGLFKYEWKFSGSTGSVNSNFVGFSGKGMARHTPGWAGLGEPLHSAKSRLRREHSGSKTTRVRCPRRYRASWWASCGSPRAPAANVPLGCTQISSNRTKHAKLENRPLAVGTRTLAA